MHPKSVPLSFIGNFFPTSNYQWVLQVLQSFSKGKMSEVMESLEYVQAYLDDLLYIISRNSLEDHLEKIEEVLRQLCDAG
jgi:hypothetical protein